MKKPKKKMAKTFWEMAQTHKASCAKHPDQAKLVELLGNLSSQGAFAMLKAH